MLSNYYEILELTPDASAVDIKAAYKRLAMLYHPDRNMGDKQAEEMFKRINEAYHFLSDPLKKSRYDVRFETRRPADDFQQREDNRRHYYQTHQPRSYYYKIDKNYFKIQGLAILVFLVFAGIAFAAAHTFMYFVERKQMEKWMANTMALKQVNGLYEAGRFKEAFDLVASLKEKDPTEFRFTFTRDSLTNALSRLAESTFDKGDYKGAVEHLLILKTVENPVKENTLKKIAASQFFLGNYDEAVRALKHLLNLHPENFELIYQIAMIELEKLDNPKEARRYFDLGKEILQKNLEKVYGSDFRTKMDPRDAPDIYHALFLGRAKANIILHNYLDAVSDGDWAVYLRKNNGDSYYLRALAKANAGLNSSLCDDIHRARQSGSTPALELQKKYCR